LSLLLTTQVAAQTQPQPQRPPGALPQRPAPPAPRPPAPAPAPAPQPSSYCMFEGKEYSIGAVLCVSSQMSQVCTAPNTEHNHSWWSSGPQPLCSSTAFSNESPSLTYSPNSTPSPLPSEATPKNSPPSFPDEATPKSTPPSFQSEPTSKSPPSLHAANVDWKLYGIADADELCFYDAQGVARTQDGKVRVGTKCLPQKDIVALDPKQELGNKILAEAEKKLGDGYVPPILVGAETDREQTSTTIAYEQAADMSGIAPRSSTFYELDCTQKMIREVNTNTSVNGQQSSSDELNGQPVPPDKNGQWLLQLLCPHPNR